ncbi:MAG TPA: pseudouridine synthase [Solirubrobacteraceae bacterium]|nr:pseudouridine synthase [Solirubrobacteraceae bacterium]
MRLAKFLAHAGAGSRRGATEMVRAGRVRVDGERELDPARRIEGGERVELDGRLVDGLEQRVVYALNKPPGVVSTARDTHGRPTVVSLIDDDRRLYPVGRLDADSTGLILLTNDGELANLLAHPRYGVSKTYRARVGGGRPSAAALDALRAGIELDDGRTAPARVRLISDDLIELELREGRKRQVRRMCEAVGHPVLALERRALGGLELAGLAPGASRKLSDAEVASLRERARR